MFDADDIYKKYSKVLSKPIYPETAEGWDALVEDFIEEMNEAAANFKSKSITIIDIKEKFGGLRIYVDYNLPSEQISDLEKIVSKYEHLSLKTCSYCGQEYKQMHKRKGYWDIVCCEECFNKRIK